VVSVNVATPAPLRLPDGGVARSSIAKRPVLGDSVWLDWTNLAGDRQADPNAHGGVDKAVYCYPSEHFDAWAAELGRPVGPASFGENLTLAGATEESVCIGDVWRWGDAVVQVAQPRYPCYKLAAHTKTPDIIERFVAAGRPGWYLRVLRPGEVPIHDASIAVEHRDAARLSVLDAHLAFSPREPSDLSRIPALLEVDALAASWKKMLKRRAAMLENRAS
jgi:MOSC domain-containing protein YiiM